MIYYLIANAKLCSSVYRYLFNNVNETDCIVHFNTHDNLKILKHIRCEHTIFLHDSGKQLWGYEMFLNNIDLVKVVYLEEKTRTTPYELDKFMDKVRFIPNMEPPSDYKTECCSAGFKMLTYLLSVKDEVDRIRLIGFTFEGWNGHDWKYEKQVAQPYLLELLPDEKIKTIRWSETNVYFLTKKEYTPRKAHMYEMFKEFRLFEINYNLPFRSVSKYQSGAMGFLRMIDLGLSLQHEHQSFQPFILLEDDVSKSEHFTNEVSYPSDCDLLYIGVSSCFSKEESNLCKITEDLYKVVGMYSTHGVVVCSAQGANVMSRCLMDAYLKNKPYDLYLSTAQSCINAYALTKPLVYQDKTLQGHEQQTSIILDDIIPTFKKVTSKLNPNQEFASNLNRYVSRY